MKPTFLHPPKKSTIIQSVFSPWGFGMIFLLPLVPSKRVLLILEKKIPIPKPTKRLDQATALTSLAPFKVPTSGSCAPFEGRWRLGHGKKLKPSNHRGVSRENGGVSPLSGDIQNISMELSNLLGVGGPMEVIVSYVSKLGFCHLFTGRIQPTYIGVIIHLLSTMDIPVGCFLKNGGKPPRTFTPSADHF